MKMLWIWQNILSNKTIGLVRSTRSEGMLFDMANF